MISHIDVVKCSIGDEQGQWIRIFLPPEISKYYKLQEPKFRLNNNSVVDFHVHHDVRKMVDSWWKEGNKFINQTSRWYGITNLRDQYMYLMVLLCRLYGEKNFSRFTEAWMPLE